MVITPIGLTVAGLIFGMMALYIVADVAQGIYRVITKIKGDTNA